MYPTGNAAVLTDAGVFYGNTQQGQHHLTLGERTNLFTILEGAARAFHNEEGVVLVQTSVAELERGATTQPGRDLESLDKVWKFTALRPWTTFVRRSDRTILHVGMLGDIKESPGPLLKGAQNEQDMAWRLARYHQLTGASWRATAGVSACAAIRDRYTDPRKGYQPLWHLNEPGIKGLRAAGPLHWQALVGQPEPGAPGAVHVWDVNAMYLAGLRNAEVAWGPLVRTGPTLFDPKWPGWWEIDVAHVPAELYDGKTRPPVFPTTSIHKRTAWLTTPVVKYLADLECQPDVLDSWTCDNPHPVFRAYAEKLMAARLGQLGPIGTCGPALKRTYAEAVGMMARDGGSIQRVDWAATGIDLSRVNFLRRLAKLNVTGARIVRISVDAVYVYCSGEVKDMVGSALGVGDGAGTFKYQEGYTVNAYLAKFGRGR